MEKKKLLIFVGSIVAIVLVIFGVLAFVIMNSLSKRAEQEKALAQAQVEQQATETANDVPDASAPQQPASQLVVGGDLYSGENIEEYIAPDGNLNDRFVAVTLSQMQRDIEIMRKDLEALVRREDQSTSNMTEGLGVIQKNFQGLVDVLREGGFISAQKSGEASEEAPAK